MLLGNFNTPFPPLLPSLLSLSFLPYPANLLPLPVATLPFINKKEREECQILDHWADFPHGKIVGAWLQQFWGVPDFSCLDHKGYAPSHRTEAKGVEYGFAKSAEAHPNDGEVWASPQIHRKMEMGARWAASTNHYIELKVIEYIKLFYICTLMGTVLTNI